MALKRELIASGLWSQYLEVGIGPDAEIFTKTPVLGSVGPRRARGHPARLVVEQPGAGGRARGGRRGHASGVPPWATM